jgi:hypothetical protein
MVSENMEHIIRNLRRLLENKQTPFKIEEVKEYRNAIKVALDIP